MKIYWAILHHFFPPKVHELQCVYYPCTLTSHIISHQTSQVLVLGSHTWLVTSMLDKAEIPDSKASPFALMSLSDFICKHGDDFHGFVCRRKWANLKVLCQLEKAIWSRLSALCNSWLSNAIPFSHGEVPKVLWSETSPRRAPGEWSFSTGSWKRFG